ncbi:hypothetical protein P7K49_009232, partial [Saguinus oedipus]
PSAALCCPLLPSVTSCGSRRLAMSLSVPLQPSAALCCPLQPSLSLCCPLLPSAAL